MWNIFPENSLSTSFVVTVWLGVCILTFFNRRFGWAMSGLVVPGLLAPTFMAKPIAGITIMLEAVLTYACVRGLSALLPKLFKASELFGRDRFFAMLLFSVPVRLIVESWFAPDILSPSLHAFGMSSEAIFDPTGIGLVIVPLLATQFWKPGIVRGLGTSLVCLGFTAALIKLILIPFTNFDFNNMALILDAFNTRVEDSPKAYIILLTTAFIASQINLRYGWDFGGILFPGLIALGLFDPLRLITTLAEALFLFFAGTLILQTRWLKNKGIEGASRVLLFFNIAFAYRMIVGHLTQWLFPQAAGNDFMALGFLIATMLAMRAADRHAGIRLLSSIGQVSLLGGAVGLALSVMLTIWPKASNHSPTDGLKALFPEDYSFAEEQEFHYPGNTVFTESSTPDTCQTGPTHRPPAMIFAPYQSLTGFFRQKLRDYPDFFAGAGAETYRPSSQATLRQLRLGVLKPLFRLQAKASVDTEIIKYDDILLESLATIQKRAWVLGFNLQILRQTNDANQTRATIILSESGDGGFCHRGLIALNIGRSIPTVITVTQPLKLKYALEASFKLFDQLGANALIVPTAHPDANTDGKSDISKYEHRNNFYLAAMEESVRELGERPLALIEVSQLDDPPTRPFGDLAQAYYDAIISYSDDHTFDQNMANLPNLLADSLSKIGIIARLKDGSASTSHATEPSPIISSLAARGHQVQAFALTIKSTVTEYLTPINAMSSWQFRWIQLGRSMKVVDFQNELMPYFHKNSNRPLPLTGEIRKEIEEFVLNQNILHLMKMETRDPTFRAELYEDFATGAQALGFFTAHGRQGDIFLVRGHWSSSMNQQNSPFLAMRQLHSKNSQWISNGLF
jgi:hypothetical protein